MCFNYFLFRRIIDPFFAFILSILLMPLFICISIIILITSGRPVFFKQKRVGHKKREFILFKFRTMIINAEKIKQKYAHLNCSVYPTFKIKNDPRVTQFGKFLRKTHFDELPQLLNVIRGDMLLIGFRPPTPDEVEKYTVFQKKRFTCYPGITSLWSSKTAHVGTFDDWIKDDLEYHNNASLFLDIKIIYSTIKLIWLKLIR